MSRSGKILLIGAGLVLALFFSVALLAAIVGYRVFHAGTAIVSVHEKKPNGTRLWLPVPVGLVDTALQFVPRSDLPRLDPEAQRWLPVAHAVVAEMERAPDAVFVEVVSPDEHVVIAKRNGRLVVEVESRHEDVRISLPAGAVAALLGEMEDWPTARQPSEGQDKT
jgi:hypothetical protein